jgi:hypothetical protein
MWSVGFPVVVVPEFGPAENPTFSTQSVVLCRASLRRVLVKSNAIGWSARMQLTGRWQRKWVVKSMQLRISIEILEDKVSGGIYGGYVELENAAMGVGQRAYNARP